MQQHYDDNKGKQYEDDSLDVFSDNYGLTQHESILALYAQLGIEVWIADSRTNQHFCNNTQLFSSYEPHPLCIGTGNGATNSPGRGFVNLSIRNSLGEFLHVHLTNVRYTPNSLLNMIFEDLLEQRGIYW